MKYRSEIDGLRAVAVISVVAYHAGFRTFSGGFVGVDIFFVISGYLITSIVLADLCKGSFSLRSFFIRRARRIIPALYVVVMFCLVPCWFLLAPSSMASFSRSLVAVPAFLTNFVFWNQSGYFQSDAALKPLLHTWSLSVEAQFYLLFPLPMLLLWKFPKTLTALLCAAALVSLIASQWWSTASPAAAFYLLPSRIWEFLAGAGIVVCRLYRSPEQPPRRDLDQALSLLGILLIAYAVVTFNSDLPFPGLYAVIPVAGACLVVAFSTPGTFLQSILSANVLVWIGALSYSIYLWHHPLFVFTKLMNGGAAGSGLLMIAAIGSVALAYPTWKYIEVPFRSDAKRTDASRKMLTLALIFVVFGGIGLATRGFIALRINHEQIAILNTARSAARRATCHTSGTEYLKPALACSFMNENVRWAVFGDSHAVEIAGAIATRLNDRNEGLKQLSFSGCEPNFGRPEVDTPCARWSREAMDYLINTKSISTVVVTYRINWDLFGDHKGIYPRLPDEIPERERLLRWRSYVDAVNGLRLGGKRVILLLQSPEISRRVEDLLFSSGSSTDVVGSSRSWWDQRNQFVKTHLTEVSEGVLIVDPTDTFCDRLSCYAVRDHKALYFDDNHMSKIGADMVAERLFSDLRIAEEIRSDASQDLESLAPASRK